MGEIVPDEGWVVQDDPGDAVQEVLEKPRTPDPDEEEMIERVPISLWRKFPSQMVGLEVHNHIPRGSCVRAGLPDPWPEFLERQAKKKKQQ
jgi:hypothetical protein